MSKIHQHQKKARRLFMVFLAVGSMIHVGQLLCALKTIQVEIAGGTPTISQYRKNPHSNRKTHPSLWGKHRRRF